MDEAQQTQDLWAEVRTIPNTEKIGEKDLGAVETLLGENKKKDRR